MKVDPQAVLSYLVSKGVPRNHALGMLSNIQAESGFNPTVNEAAPLVPGSRGGFGLFQHTGSRRRALEALPGFKTWQTQVDFALSEPDTKRYLAQKFETPEAASRWFTTRWERPANAEQQAEARLKYLPAVDVRLASNTPDIPPEMQTPGDPATGEATMAGSLPFQDTGIPWQLPPGDKPSFGERLATDPFFQMGAAILGAPGHGGNFMAAVGQGMSQGLQNVQAAEQARQRAMMEQVSQMLQAQRIAMEQQRFGLDQARFDQTMDYQNRSLDLQEQRLALPPVAQPTAGQQNVEYLVSQGMDPQQAIAMVFGPQQGPAPSGYQWTPSGTLAAIPGGPATIPTEGERSSASYAERMAHAEDLIQAAEQQHGLYRPGFWDKLAPNWMQSEEAQNFRNASDQWIRAKLRRESGAAIAEEEWASEYKTFFPAVGDKPATIAQKRAARLKAEESMRVQAGRAAGSIPEREAPGAGMPSLQPGQSAEIAPGVIIKRVQ